MTFVGKYKQFYFKWRHFRHTYFLYTNTVERMNKI